MRYHYTTPVRPPILSTARIPRNTPTVLTRTHLRTNCHCQRPSLSPCHCRFPLSLRAKRGNPVGAGNVAPATVLTRRVAPRNDKLGRRQARRPTTPHP